MFVFESIHMNLNLQRFFVHVEIQWNHKDMIRAKFTLCDRVIRYGYTESSSTDKQNRYHNVRNSTHTSHMLDMRTHVEIGWSLDKKKIVILHL